jgi:hypothetical protein
LTASWASPTVRPVSHASSMRLNSARQLSGLVGCSSPVPGAPPSSVLAAGSVPLAPASGSHTGPVRRDRRRGRDRPGPRRRRAPTRAGRRRRRPRARGASVPRPRVRRRGTGSASQERHGTAHGLRRRGGGVVGERRELIVVGQSFGGFTAPLSVWPDVETRFVLCTEDGFFPAELMGAWFASGGGTNASWQPCASARATDGHNVRRRGSRPSRSASPSALNDHTSRKIARPGTVTNHIE